MEGYKLQQPVGNLPSAGVIRLSDGAFIPHSEDNLDWVAYLEWAAIPGNVVQPADPIPPVVVAGSYDALSREQKAILITIARLHNIPISRVKIIYTHQWDILANPGTISDEE